MHATLQSTTATPDLHVICGPLFNTFARPLPDGRADRPRFFQPAVDVERETLVHPEEYERWDGMA